jgi:transposase
MAVERDGDRWVISAAAREIGSCPGCGARSRRRHSRYSRCLQDLPAQGAIVALRILMTRWRCSNRSCPRKTFSDQLPGVAVRHARRTLRISRLLQLFAHGAGGKPSERLINRLGMPASDDTLLRHLKKGAARGAGDVRVLGVDDWSWRKGESYGTVMVDLERREVVDVLPGRSAEETADWLSRHPNVEVVSRDRCGLYAQGIRHGAPQARQVADRFHLLQNLRERIEHQLSRSDKGLARPSLPRAEGEDAGLIFCSTPGRQVIAEDRYLKRLAYQRSRQAMFEKVQILKAEGRNIRGIAVEMGVNWRTVRKWVHANEMPELRERAPTPTLPRYFRDYLTDRWANGCRGGRQLFEEIRQRGYRGSRSNMERLLGKWRGAERTALAPNTAPTPIDSPATTTAPALRAVDPATDWAISPIVGAALCIKPRGMLTARQAAKVAALKNASPDFVAMRALAMRFRGVLHSKDVTRLDKWLDDAQRSGVYAMQRFACKLRSDIHAVRKAVAEPWSNGQTEGQINRLKTLKRAMYGRASAELLRARMIPLSAFPEHEK